MPTPKSATMLNQRGRTNCDGEPFNAQMVGHIRRSRGLKTRAQRLRDQGMVTTRELADRLGISEWTVRDLGRKRLLDRQPCGDRCFLYQPAGKGAPRSRMARNSPKDRANQQRSHKMTTRCSVKHYPIDSTMCATSPTTEDRCRVRTGHLPRNLACLTNLAISIVRLKGRFDSIPQAHRHYARRPQDAVRQLINPPNR